MRRSGGARQVFRRRCGREYASFATDGAEEFVECQRRADRDGRVGVDGRGSGDD